MPKVIKLDSPQKEELLTGKKVRFEDPANAAVGETEEKVNKTLNFPEIAAENYDQFHVVRGRRVCGLLVDPGAASGLVGTETLRELLEAIPPDSHHKIEWGPSTTSVTGISGQSDSTLARVSLPIHINSNEPASYTADLIGGQGQGSLCPALLPNTSLRQMRSAVFTEWFENGDGMMVCSPNGHRLDHPEAHLVIMRILLTESGHYIIPVNQQSEFNICDDDKAKIKQMLQGHAKPYQTTTLEQTGNSHECNIHDTENLIHNDSKDNIPSNNQGKLQFATEDASAGNEIHDGLRMDPVSNGLCDGLRGDMKQVASDEKPIQVLLGHDYNIDYDEATVEYQGDTYPGHLADGKLRYLQKMYRAIPEEYYSKLKKVPVTPYNARSWARKNRGKRFQFQEWCSGSGRLSLLAILAGLCVLFPIDYRYGWDLGLPEHQRIIHEVEQDIGGGPDVLFYSPACRPWSISATKRDLDQTQRERAAEQPTLDYIKKKYKQRSKDKKGNVLEQPWSSALWGELEDLPGERFRTDQCRHGARDEEGNQILKPTGLKSDFHLKHCISRCNGHHGRKHGWLQGAVSGMNRTTMASVYPEPLCRAIIRDIKKYLSYKNMVEDYYKCQRCAMGRAATADMEHSFLPGECRYGKWPEGEGPRERKRLEREQQEKDNIFENFRKEALSNPKVMQGKLAAHPSISFDSEQTAILKMCLIKLLSTAVDEFDKLEKKKGDQNYVHWLEDPTALGWLQRIFKDYMDLNKHHYVFYFVATSKAGRSVKLKIFALCH
eukprot:s393_g6.t1